MFSRLISLALFTPSSCPISLTLSPRVNLFPSVPASTSLPLRYTHSPLPPSLSSSPSFLLSLLFLPAPPSLLSQLLAKGQVTLFRLLRHSRGSRAWGSSHGGQRDLEGRCRTGPAKRGPRRVGAAAVLSELVPRAWLPPLGLMQSLEGSPRYSLAGTWGRPDMATLTPGGAVFLPARWVSMSVRVPYRCPEPRWASSLGVCPTFLGGPGL